MSNTISSYCHKVIAFCFYTLFLFVPLVFVGSTSELFELNKMWLTWNLTILIGIAWITKMIVNRQLHIQRTPLDIILFLFFLSQCIATIFSLDPRISVWGYYSRFNGGLLSTFSYLFLYYAYVSNITKEQTIRLLKVLLVSGLFVALWGLPSHFGKDPTCFVFRGTLDVSCWTDAFKPTVRIFSTLGQPAWLAAFVSVLLPLTMGFALIHKPKKNIDGTFITLFILTILFYLCLLYSNTRAGFLGFWAANALFWFVVFIKNLIPRKQFISTLLLFNIVFLLCNFFVGTPIAQLNKITFSSLTAQNQPQAPKQPATEAQQQSPTGQTITDSGDIRLHVWKGAVDAWKARPVFGYGVETFAFAYYRHRPVEHNLTSEWDYLYNKAHNEYLNYLTTSGIVGLGTYLLFILFFIFLTGKFLVKTSMHSEDHESQTLSLESQLLTLGLFTGWLSILVTNFFGFSVVIINLFLFLIPAFIFVITQIINPDHAAATPSSVHHKQSTDTHVTVSQWASVIAITLIGLYMLFLLFRFWQADKAYALGSNLARAGSYDTAYLPLQQAVAGRPTEPIFKDELAGASANIALALFEQQEATAAAQFAQQAVDLNNDVLTNHQNNIVFWKSRIRVFYTLAQIDPNYFTYALQAAEQATRLAPTDAKILYNLGVLYGQTDNTEKAITTLQKTIQLRPHYEEAHFALGLFYRDAAVNENDQVVNREMQQKAEETMQYILDNLNPNNEQVKETVASWN